MMEDNRTSSNSDRDRKMMGRFENYADKSDDDDDEKGKDAKKSSKAESAPAAREETKEPEPSLFDWMKGIKAVERADKPVEDSAEAIELTPVEELADDEVQQIIDQYVEARSEDLREDLQVAPEDSVEEAVALANAALLETIQEQGAATEEELDAAVAETAEDLELATEAEPEPDDEPEAATVTSTTGTTGTSGSSGRGTGTPPPIPPTPPTPPTPTPGPGLPPGGPPVTGGNVLPTPANNPNTWQPNRRRAGDLLLGGVVGYLIGRRRGRLKTEARLMPVQEKLEKQVKDLHDKVAEREARIRRLAAEKMMQEPETARPALIQKLEARAERKQPETTPVLEAAPAAPAETPMIRPETLGRFVLPGAEVPRQPERRVERVERSTETMTMPELLAVAERIERNGVSVREMYARGRLDALGLRRVVHEYLNGDHLDRVLSEQLKPVESPETLPQTQPPADNNPLTTASGVTTATTTSPLHQAMDQARAPEPAHQPLPSVFQPPTKKLTPNQTGMAIGLAAAVLFLLLVLILL